jgi:hypothetical protein
MFALGPPRCQGPEPACSSSFVAGCTLA